MGLPSSDIGVCSMGLDLARGFEMKRPEIVMVLPFTSSKLIVSLPATTPKVLPVLSAVKV